MRSFRIELNKEEKEIKMEWTREFIISSLDRIFSKSETSTFNYVLTDFKFKKSDNNITLISNLYNNNKISSYLYNKKELNRTKLEEYFRHNKIKSDHKLLINSLISFMTDYSINLLTSITITLYKDTKDFTKNISKQLLNKWLLEKIKETV